MWIRERRDSDETDLVAALQAVHERDRYPLRPGNISWEWIVAPAGGPAWVTEIDGRAAGHVALTPEGPAVDGEALSVTRLFVGHSARGTGAGAALLATAERHARDADVPLVLEVLDGSDSAILLYEKRGWTRFDTVTADWTAPDGEHPTLHLYRAPR